MTDALKVGDAVRMGRTVKGTDAVPFNQAGTVTEVSPDGTDIMVDFGPPWGVRGCRHGECLAPVSAP